MLLFFFYLFKELDIYNYWKEIQKYSTFKKGNIKYFTITWGKIPTNMTKQLSKPKLDH